MHRLFAAIDLPDSIKETLDRFCHGIPGAKWVLNKQFHLTLRFIGEVDGAVFSDVAEALSEIQVAPFELRLKGMGFFPPRGEPQLLWAGVDKSEPVIHLRNKIERILIQAGLEPEGRKFSPHITLARLKGAAHSKVSEFLAFNGLYQSPVFSVTEFCLFSSFLSKSGSIYQKEESYLL